MVKFFCQKCGHKLKANTDRAGKRCKCTRCGQVMYVPVPSPDNQGSLPSPTPPLAVSPPSPAAPPPFPPARKKAVLARILVASFAAGLLAIAAIVTFLLYPKDIDQRLSDLKGGTPEARRQALVWLASADLDEPHRSPVTAALEPLLFEGDIRGDLKPDLILRAYLHWADQDNVPTLIRMVQSPTVLNMAPDSSTWILQALARMQDPRVADVLAENLDNPALREQAFEALRFIGPEAGIAVLQDVFAPDPGTRDLANRLLAEYGTPPNRIAVAALARLQSTDPDARSSAAVWFAENPPADAKQQAEVAKALATLLDDLSPRVNAVALRALKLWATPDCLPQLVAFAKRDPKAACPTDLIDLLARFPDESAAEALALQLKIPANRELAAQAILKVGTVASKALLPYVDDPDIAVRNEARDLSQKLNTSSMPPLDRILADLADPSKARACTALDSLAKLRPDEADRARVSGALNALLLDSDPSIRAKALDAVRVWGSKANTATILKLLSTVRTAGVARDPGLIGLLGSLQDPTAAAALAEGLTRPEELDASVRALIALGSGSENAVLPYLDSTDRGARFASCWILGEVGTHKSVSALESAQAKSLDNAFNERVQLAIEKITARG
jgi:hypothetical protein